MESALHRLPVLERTGIRKFYNGPESFTPDNQFILGESPDVAGFFVGAGFNSVGIASAGGAGRALAEWVVAGEPQEDLALVDLRRFAPFHASTPWLRERVSRGARPALRRAVAQPRARLGAAVPLLTGAAIWMTEPSFVCGRPSFSSSPTMRSSDRSISLGCSCFSRANTSSSSGMTAPTSSLRERPSPPSRPRVRLGWWRLRLGGGIAPFGVARGLLGCPLG